MSWLNVEIRSALQGFFLVQCLSTFPFLSGSQRRIRLHRVASGCGQGQVLCSSFLATLTTSIVCRDLISILFHCHLRLPICFFLWRRTTRSFLPRRSSLIADRSLPQINAWAQNSFKEKSKKVIHFAFLQYSLLLNWYGSNRKTYF